MTSLPMTTARYGDLGMELALPKPDEMPAMRSGL